MGNETIKNNIRLTRRGKADITQEELAVQAGCTRQTIVSLEKGKYNPSLFLAIKIAKILGVTVDDLFQIEEKE